MIKPFRQGTAESGNKTALAAEEVEADNT